MTALHFSEFRISARRRFGFVVLAIVLVGLLQGAGAAQAACSDPPGPEVNWQRCALDGLVFLDSDLTGARLRDASFLRSDLSGADLSGVEGFHAKFINSIMHGTRLDGGTFYQADFTKADLTGASFVGTDLRLTRFYRAILVGVDFTGADLDGVDLTRADLSGATWTDGEKICAEGSIGRCL